MTADCQVTVAAIGLDHRHIFGQLAGMLAVGCRCKGWWTAGEPETISGLVKRFPDFPRVSERDALLLDPEFNLMLTAAVPSEPAATSPIRRTRNWRIFL